MKDKKSKIKVYAAELKRIAGKSATLTPDQVVAAAKSPSSPLHDAFDWDDKIASHKWRVHQARLLLNSIVLKNVIDGRLIPTPYWVHDPASGNDQGYISTAKIKKDPDNTRALILEEFERASGHLKRARDLATVLEYDGDISELLTRLDTLGEEIQHSVS